MQIVGNNTGAGSAMGNYKGASAKGGGALTVLRHAEAQTSRPSFILDEVVVSPARETDADGKAKDKKAFKSVKELVDYLMLLVARWLQAKPAPGEGPVKLEDRVRYQELKDELDSITSERTIIL